MNLDAMVDERLVRFGFEGTTKDEILHGVAALLYDTGKVNDYDAYVAGLYEREKDFVTGIGHGIAIPHCKGICVNTASFTLIRLKNDIEWGSLDNQPVRYVIMLAAPAAGDNIHLKMLAKLSAKLVDDTFREKLLAAQSVDEIHILLKEAV